MEVVSNQLKLFLVGSSFIELTLRCVICLSDLIEKFVEATVIEKLFRVLKIHYNAGPTDCYCYCDYEKETYRFAKVGSISKHAARAHRFKNLTIGNFIGIKSTSIKCRTTQIRWLSGEIRGMDEHSGPVNVIYDYQNQSYRWSVHLDDIGNVPPLRAKLVPTILFIYLVLMKKQKNTINAILMPFKKN